MSDTVVVSCRAADPAALLRLAQAQVPRADQIELRLDALTDPAGDLTPLLDALDRPVTVALNGPEAFGSFTGSDGERLRVLRRAAEAGAAFVDVPWTLAAQLGCLPNRARRVVSRHVLEGTPDDLAALAREVQPALLPGDRLKLVTHARSAEDGLRMLRFVAERAAQGAPIVGFCSGDAGAFTRVLAPLHGSLATYAAPVPLGGSGEPTAPGQLRIDAVRAAWPAAGPSARTEILAVLGKPVQHSLSPRIHGAALRALGIDAVYVACEPESLAQFLALCDARWRGFAVTMPFKEEAARLAILRDADVAASGAANTLVRTANGWQAHNTDVVAVRLVIGRALAERGRTLESTRALVVGTGGAARAALIALRGAHLSVAGRDAERCAALARELGVEACSIGDVTHREHDVLVHATPLGSRANPDAMPIPLDALRAGSIVLDAVYRPSDTPLLRAARAAGAQAIPGADWFLAQAAAQFALVTRRDTPVDTLRTELTRALGHEGSG